MAKTEKFMLKHLITTLGLIFFCAFAWIDTSHGQTLGFKKRVYIDIDQAKVKKSLLAITPFGVMDKKIKPKNQKLAQKLYASIMQNLELSFLFETLDKKSWDHTLSKSLLPQSETQPEGFDFENWSTLGVDFLIRSAYKTSWSKMQLVVYVYYVPHKTLVFSKSYTHKKKHMDFIAHSLANDLVKSLTRKGSFFLSRLVSVRYKGFRGKKEIWAMDWNTKNAKQITRTGLSISPAWSPLGNLIAYTAFSVHKRGKKYLGRNADLYLYNIKRKRHSLLSYIKGINSGADFLPSGRGLVFTRTRKGEKNTDIFRVDVTGKNLTALTMGPYGAMNIEPAVSPDGTKIAFSSDRSGRPHIYVMPIDGESKQVAKVLTFAGVYNSTPRWSPDGEKIVFASFDRRRQAFDVFLINANGRGLKRLTSARKINGRWSNNEYPIFAPGGTHILFVSDRSGKKQLYMTDTAGRNLKRISFDAYYYESPRFLNSHLPSNLSREPLSKSNWQ